MQMRLVGPGRSLRHARWFRSARPRRIGIYLLAAVLVVVIGSWAARLARPPDPYGAITVTTLPGITDPENTQTTSVRWNPETGRTTIDVREPDGVVRRYVVQSENGELTIWGSAEAPPEGR